MCVYIQCTIEMIMPTPKRSGTQQCITIILNRKVRYTIIHSWMAENNLLFDDTIHAWSLPTFQTIQGLF